MGENQRLFTRVLVVLIGATSTAQAGPLTDRPVWVGTGSCAALACHGGRREVTRPGGSEYAYWASYDPHNRAFSALFDARSRQIEANYRRLVDAESARPFADDFCLKCHVHQGFDGRDTTSHAASFALDDGAGCESCHGSAGKWLAPHAEVGWKTLTVGQKEQDFGFRTTKDLLVRARICAECHVGTGSADVNHDLIAAGHPRLNFDYAGQLAKLPRHWKGADDRARHPDFEARTWALGRLAGARAALDLLETRARRAIPDDSVAPWPEFAEYGCFSCHQGLNPSGTPTASRPPGLVPGIPPWGTWPFAPATIPGETPRPNEPNDPVSPLGQLRALMAQSDPDPAAVARSARVAADELGQRAEALNRRTLSLADLRAALAGAVEASNPEGPADWDTAAQSYLTIVALKGTLAEFDARYANPRVRSGVASLYQNLNLPTRTDRGLFDSPVAFDPAQIRGDLLRVRNALPPQPSRTAP